MSHKSEKTGVVISNKMQKSIVVAVESQRRHGLYGKTERRTSKFVAHDENNTAKIGDRVAIVESRPLSKRKRWVVTKIVRPGKEYDLVAENELGESCYASPAISDGQMFIRSDRHVYAIGPRK